MKIAQKILAILWMAICLYYCSMLAAGIFDRGLSSRSIALTLQLFFILLYFVGTFVSFYVLTGAGWARIVLGFIALLTMTASLAGLLAFFNSQPFSAIGVSFDMFAAVSVVCMVSPRHS